MARSFPCLIAVTLSLMIVCQVRAEDQVLGIGSPAPKLEVNDYVKGEPIKKFEAKKVYVVEFWATWCGPCKTSIPHLTELQKKNKDAVFIGVSVWEDDPTKVAPFVEKMGDKMDYRVALDQVPFKGDADDGKMAKNWMKAAKQTGIPTAFVVNGDGVIAWIGHPGELDKPLAKIMAGKWDVAAAAKRDKVKQEIVAKFEKAENEKPADLVKFLDEKFAADPELEESYGVDKLGFMLKSADGRDKTAAYAAHLIEKVAADDRDMLSTIAEDILNSGSEELNDVKMLALGVKAVERADALAGSKDDQIAELLAKAYFAKGDAPKAATALQRAIKLAKAAPEADKEQIEEWEQRLKKYEKAAEKK